MTSFLAQTGNGSNLGWCKCSFLFPAQAIDVLDEAGSRVRIATWQRYRAAAADIGSREGATPGPPWSGNTAGPRWSGAWQELSDVQAALREAVRDDCYEEAGE